MSRPALSLAFLLACGSAVLADEVQLRDGHIITGIAKEIDGKIVVETGYGTVTYPRDQVLSILPGNTPLHDFPGRLAAIEKSGDAEAFVRLANWAKENRLPKHVDGLMRRALDLDADNADARAALGFVRHEGRWMTASQVNQEKGRVLFEGRWMLPLEKELLEARRLDAIGRRMEREAAEAKRREAERRAREEARIRAAAAERERRVVESPRLIRRRASSSSPIWSDAFEILLVGRILGFSCWGGPALPFRLPVRIY